MRRTIPNLTLRTSFVVGFPGETEKEFGELCTFTKEAGFDWMGAFGYSDQEGAGAFDLETKVSPREIESRRKSLMSIQKKISRAKKKALVGRELESPDIRAGLAFVIAAIVAKGDSVINNVYHIDRGYEEVEKRLKAIGVSIERVK